VPQLYRGKPGPGCDPHGDARPVDPRLGNGRHRRLAPLTDPRAPRADRLRRPLRALRQADARPHRPVRHPSRRLAVAPRRISRRGGRRPAPPAMRLVGSPARMSFSATTRSPWLPV